MNADAPAPHNIRKAPRPRPWLLAALAAVLVALMAVGVGTWWALRSEGGQRWLLSHVPGLELEGAKGRLDGGPFSVTRLRWSSEGLKVTVDDLSWRDARWQWRPFTGTWLGLTLTSPSARRVTLVPLSQTQNQTAQQPPDNLRLPLALKLSGLRIEALQWAEAPPVRKLAGNIDIGADQGGVHRGTLEADVTTWHLRADIRVGANAPMAIEGHVLAEQTAASNPWRGQAHVLGTLRAPEVAASLTQGGKDVLEARASLRPFQSQMLASLQARTSGLDLAGLVPGAPATRLTGDVTAQAPSAGRPLLATLTVDNAEPGPWDAARLPLRRLEASARVVSASDVRLQTCEAALQGGREAGELRCTGQWTDDTLRLQLQLNDVRTDALHGAAPLMTLSGHVEAILANDSRDKAAVAAPGQALRPTGSQIGSQIGSHMGSRTGSQIGLLKGSIEADLTGSLHALPRGKGGVEVTGRADFQADRAADGELGPWRIQVHDLIARAGPASLHADMRLQADQRQTWQVESEGDMRHFDPSVWWAGPPGIRLRDRRHDLNAGWKVQWTIAKRPATAEALPELQGTAQLAVHPSVLAGVPITAQATVDAAGDVLHVQARSDVGGNKADADVRWPIAGSQAPRWSGSVQAPRLGALGPWKAVIPSLAAWVPTGGSLEGRVNGTGRFPDMAVSGDLQATGVRSVQWGIATLDAAWQAHGLQPRAPLSLTLRASQAHYGGWSAPSLAAQVRGTIAAHRLFASGTIVQTQTAAEGERGGTPVPPRRDAFELALTGSWGGASGCHGTWRGHIENLRARSMPAGQPAWLQAHGLDASVALGPDCGWQAASIAPGQLQALGATVRWSDAHLRRSKDGPPRGRLLAQVMPMALAPILARLQPDRKWSGDLRLAASAALAFEDRLSGRVVLERTAGDLRLQTDAGPMSLGLQDLRITAESQGRTWHLREQLAGRTIGKLEGAQAIAVLDGPLPSKASAVQGHLSVQAPELAAWSVFLPAPWQVSGKLQGQVSVSGKLGMPVLTGDLQGQDLAVQNVLEGINLHEGKLHATVQGQQAVLDRLSFKGGDGEVIATGQASFGKAPRATIDVRAHRLQALGRVDRTIVLSGQAIAHVVEDRVRLDGRFDIDHGLIDISTSEAPSLDEDVVLHKGGRIVDVEGRPMTTPSDGQRNTARQQAQVSVWVGLGDDLRLRGKGLDTLLKGRLHVTTPEGELAVNGTVRTEGGRYTAYGQNLVIDRGLIQFKGPLATPRLDILALRDDVDIRVGVAINGSAADPRVRLYSEPEMSDTDKLSWLVMGRAPEGLGQEDLALLQRAALALVAGQKGKPAGGGLIKRLGLDEVSLRRGDSGELRDTVVSLGKQLSEHWKVSYEQGLNATVGSWRLIYRLAREIDFRLSSGAESAVDVVKTWRFD